MNKAMRISLPAIILLVISACTLFGPPNQVFGETSALKLVVQTQNGATTFSHAGEVINYNYVVTNTGTARLAGPVIVTDPPRQINCPDVTTVGNGDNYLDQNETITCTAAYTISQSDVNTGSVTNLATANAGGVNSNQSGVTLTLSVPSSTLILTKTASSQTYGQAGQTITYNFVITNTGTAPLGPAQFVIADNKLGAPFNCGPADTTLQPNQPINCSAPYIITQADMAAATLVNTATASGGGQTSAPATATITNLAAPATQTPPTAQPQPTVQSSSVCPQPNLSPGTTIQHCVAVGEWMIQIARCYGVTISALRDANPQITDLNLIWPYPTTGKITVPNIGSASTVYGPPCVNFYTVRSGDTWISIAQQNNACLAVLQEVNGAGLTAGTVIKIPRNSTQLYCPSSPASPAVTANPSVTQTPGVVAQRITLGPGETNAVRVGVINPNETIQFVINAPQGSVLGVKLTAPANEVSIGVTGPTGLALKPLDPTPTWNTTITTGGDHYITLQSVAGTSSKSYTLEVSLTPPNVPATATATATATP